MMQRMQKSTHNLPALNRTLILVGLWGGVMVGGIAIASCSTAASLNTQASTPASTPPDSALSTPIAQATTLQPQILAENLEHPWSMAWLPDGSMLITERPGRLRMMRNGKLDPNPIAGVPAVFASGQGGLLDIALHPRFQENQWVYFSYSAGDRNTNQTKVARAKFDGKTLTDWQDILQADPTKTGTQHFGSRLLWLPDETLLISIGDGGNPPLQIDGELSRKQAQNLSSRLGKVLRIKDDGSVPADNPFVNQANAAPEIWTYGHRNIQGLALDAATGQVWASEHGSRGGDELNRLEAGKNYGWPEVSYSREYTADQMVAPVTTRPDVPDPLVVWTPSIAPSGLMVYQGDQLAGWQSNLLAGALVSQEIRRIEVDGQGQAEEVGAIAIGQRVRDVRQGPDGLIYVLTDEDAGQLIRLEPAQ